MERKILDSDISQENYAAFEKCEICDDGLKIKFTLAGGSVYEVPLEYILMWFAKPHYMSVQNELKEWENEEYSIDKKDFLKVIKCQRVLDNTAIRIFLDNDSVYDIPWDTVLMACERQYEHFGGLTEESKEIVSKWWSEKQQNRSLL